MDTVGRTQIVILFLLTSVCYGQAPVKDTAKNADPVTETERRVKTRYDAFGRPVNQGQNTKGFHQVIGTTKLVSGGATINLNTSTASGKQDVSFISKNTFRGTAYSLDSANANTYRVIPKSAAQAIIVSSDPADTATVHYVLEGE
jgi:hypothetical protein